MTSFKSVMGRQEIQPSPHPTPMGRKIPGFGPGRNRGMTCFRDKVYHISNIIFYRMSFYYKKRPGDVKYHQIGPNLKKVQNPLLALD